MNFILKNNSKNHFIVIVILSLLLYNNTIKNNYSIDDDLVTSTFNNNSPSISNIFTSYTFSDKAKSYNFSYRPILLSSFAIEKAIIGKLNPHFSHFINLLLITLIFSLVYYFLSSLFNYKYKVQIFITILFFMVNPILTEIVNNIKSRDELLVILFGLLTLTFFIKYLKTSRLYYLLFVIIFIILGILSKKSFLVFSFILPIIDVFYTKKLFNKKLFISIIFSVIPLFILFISKQIFLSETAQIRSFQFFENPLYSYSFFQRIPSGLVIPLHYIKIFFLPFNLSFYYGYNTISLYAFNSIYPYFAIVFYLFLLIISIKYFKKYILLSFGLLLVLLQSIAVSNIFIPLPGIIAERFYFIGSLGISIIVVHFLFILIQKLNLINIINKIKLKNSVYILIIIIILPFIVITINRNTAWKDSFTLFKTDIDHLKNSAKANELLGSIYLEKYYKTKNLTLLDSAQKYCENSVNVYEKYPSIWNSLGYIYFIKLNYIEAEKAYINSAKYSTNNANPYYNLAVLYERINNIEKAKQSYIKVLEINPNLPNYLPYIKAFIVKYNFTDLFIDKLEILLENSYNYNLEILIIDLYNTKKSYTKMLEHLKKVYSTNPSESIKKVIIETENNLQ